MQNPNDAGGSRKVLTFSLGGEVYGIDILCVKEIRGWTPVTRIPHSSASVLGVQNLRGVIVPIIDLRVHFAMAAAEFNATTVIIVLSLQTGEGDREIGIVVDTVEDVVEIDVAGIRPAPPVGASIHSGFIAGIATVADQMLILLDAGCLSLGEQLSTGPASAAA